MNDLRKELKDAGLPEEVVSLLSQPASRNLHLILKNVGEGYTAIQNSQIPIFREVGKIVAGALGSTLSGWAPAALAGLVFLLVDIRKKGVGLTVVQGVILKDIRNFSGISTQDLCVGLGLREEELLRELEFLRGGTEGANPSTRLIEQREGGWYSLDV